jgi:hypothetical protein
MLGIVDTPASQQELSRGLAAAGFAKIESLSGEGGLQLLARIDHFFFSDLAEKGPRTLHRRAQGWPHRRRH